jgi:hypothetical protein
MDWVETVLNTAVELLAAEKLKISRLADQYAA